MSKRVTIQIDVTNENLIKVLELVNDLHRQLQFQVMEYDPVFNFDRAIRTIED